jgi:hypothetical protein
MERGLDGVIGRVRLLIGMAARFSLSDLPDFFVMD